MHYGCASFEIFWILAIIIFERVFTFPPRRWFAPNISLWFPACIHNNKIFELAPPLCLSLSRNCSYYSCCEGNYVAFCASPTAYWSDHETVQGSTVQCVQLDRLVFMIHGRSTWALHRLNRSQLLLHTGAL